MRQKKGRGGWKGGKMARKGKGRSLQNSVRFLSTLSNGRSNQARNDNERAPERSSTCSSLTKTMVLVRVAHLSDLQVPSDQVGSKMHYPASEVLPQKRAGSTGVSFSGLAVANDSTARCVAREPLSRAEQARKAEQARRGLSKHGVPSLSPLTIHSGSGPASPIAKPATGAIHHLHACGPAHRLAALQRRSGSSGSGSSGGSGGIRGSRAAAVVASAGVRSRPPLQPCPVQPPPSRALGASGALHASPLRKRVAQPPPPRPRYGCSIQARSRALHVPLPRRARVPCA